MSRKPLNNLPYPQQPLRQLLSACALFVSLSICLTDVSNANVVGSDTQNFNPTHSGLDFVTVQSSETLDPGVFNLGLFFNHAVNTLPYFDGTGEQGRLKFSDSLTGADIHVGLGLMPGWEIGIGLPHVVDQQLKRDGFHGQFAKNGNTEVRLHTKFRLFGDDEGGVAVIGSTNINRIKDNPYTGKNAGPTYNAELAFDTTVKRVALGLNLGYRFRDPGQKESDETPVDPMGDQGIASVAASYHFTSIDTKLIAEIFGSKPADKQTENSDRLSSSAEALLGLKHDINQNFALHGGLGTELQHGISSPDWRAYLGLNWTTGPKFSKPKHAVKTEPAEKAKKFGKSDPFAGTPKPVEKIVIHDILFEFDSDHLVLSGANGTLTQLVQYLNKPPAFTRLVIEGHTDSVGSEAYNADLSKRRAATIKKWIVTRYKIDPKKIETRGVGESDPIADNGNYQGRQLNRRVEFTIYRK
jgi:outer membrane protein OmpA-like peptidoglycan-associated protein